MKYINIEVCLHSSLRSVPCGRNRPIVLIGHTLFTLQMPHLSSFETNRVAGATELKKNTLTQRNMESFQGLVILIVACTIVTCALQILCFFLLKRTKNVSSSRINEDVNGHNREPGNPRKINIQWPHLNGRKPPIEQSEQSFNQVQAS